MRAALATEARWRGTRKSQEESRPSLPPRPSLTSFPVLVAGPFGRISNTPRLWAATFEPAVRAFLWLLRSVLEVERYEQHEGCHEMALVRVVDNSPALGDQRPTTGWLYSENLNPYRG